MPNRRSRRQTPPSTPSPSPPPPVQVVVSSDSEVDLLNAAVDPGIQDSLTDRAESPKEVRAEAAIQADGAVESMVEEEARLLVASLDGKMHAGGTQPPGNPAVDSIDHPEIPSELHNEQREVAREGSPLTLEALEKSVDAHVEQLEAQLREARTALELFKASVAATAEEQNEPGKIFNKFSCSSQFSSPQQLQHLFVQNAENAKETEEAVQTASPGKPQAPLEVEPDRGIPEGKGELGEQRQHTPPSLQETTITTQSPTQRTTKPTISTPNFRQVAIPPLPELPAVNKVSKSSTEKGMMGG